MLKGPFPAMSVTGAISTPVRIARPSVIVEGDGATKKPGTMVRTALPRGSPCSAKAG